MYCNVTQYIVKEYREPFDSLYSWVLAFDVWLDEVEFLQDMGDVVNPVISVNIAHFEVVIGLKDCLA